MILTSFQDKPITTLADDELGLEVYTKSLAKFIQSCHAPMTIGLQGNWGTGKTSLMKLLQADVTAAGIKSIWVNTWEHSVFVPASETTPQILLAMAEQLRALKRLDDDTRKEKALDAAEDLFFVGRNALNQFVAKTLGVDISKAKAEEQHTVKTSPVARIRDTMTKLISQVITSDKNQTQKVVFFIDDLDRIKPSEAVEVIEALKNVFDEIPYCVFVLAIDYEVIKKGLRARYGDEKNAEREFKSFFDKMIQVPFRMPTGAMDYDTFVKVQINKLGISEADNYFGGYSKILSSSIGTNPRSLKRFFNTFSLQRDIVSAVAQQRNLDRIYRKNGEIDFLLAISNAMQIAFPKTWDLFLVNQDLENWSVNEFELIGMDLNLEQEVIDSELQGDISFENLPKLFEIGLFTELNRIMKFKSPSIENALQLILDTVKITSFTQPDPDLGPKARAEVAFETHFAYTKLKELERKQRFEELLEALNDGNEYSIKIARTQCSFKKNGHTNSVYLQARPSKITFTTAARSNEKVCLAVFNELLAQNKNWKVKHYTKGTYHLIGEFDYKTDVKEFLEKIRDVTTQHLKIDK